MSVQQWVTPLQGLDSLRQTEVPMPTPSHGEVLVEIHTVSLNYRDVESVFIANPQTAQNLTGPQSLKASINTIKLPSRMIPSSPARTCVVWSPTLVPA